jgi:opacity protein-like surface antigen
VLPPDAQPALQPPSLQPGGVPDPVKPLVTDPQAPTERPPQANPPTQNDQSIEYLHVRPLAEQRPAASNVYRPPNSAPKRLSPSADYQPPADSTNEVPYEAPAQPGYIVPAFEPLPGSGYQPSVVVQPPPAGQAAGHPWSGYVRPHTHFRHEATSVYQPAVANVAPAEFCDPCCRTSTVRQGSRIGTTGCDPCGELNCSDFYFGFHGGWNDLQTMTGTDSQWETEAGHVFNFALGRVNGCNLRTEVELGFRGNSISNVSDSAGSPGSAGQISLFTGMTNAYWELVDFPGGRFKPYVGGGVGFASSRVSLTDSLGANLLDEDGDQDTSFAYQWMAGVNFKARRDLDVFVEYRFFEADAFEFGSSVSSVDGGYDYQANSVGIGFRWKF